MCVFPGPVLPDESTPAPPAVKAPRMAPNVPDESDPESADFDKSGNATPTHQPIADQ